MPFPPMCIDRPTPCSASVLFRSSESRARVQRELLGRLRQLEHLLDLVRAVEDVSLARAIAGRNVLNPLAHEYDGAGLCFQILHIRIDESFEVELAEHKSFSRPIEADETFVFVPFALGVLRLRRIGARVSHTDETGSEDALVFAFDRAVARLSFTGSAPLANEDTRQRRSDLSRVVVERSPPHRARNARARTNVSL